MDYVNVFIDERQSLGGRRAKREPGMAGPAPPVARGLEGSAASPCQPDVAHRVGWLITTNADDEPACSVPLIVVRRLFLSARIVVVALRDLLVLVGPLDVPRSMRTAPDARPKPRQWLTGSEWAKPVAAGPVRGVTVMLRCGEGRVPRVV